ncbi:diadenylate cyclase [Lacipirellula parvula]|uniref:Diadenylate cyclase spyDAC n=1 Tax=Lacipirellula parvula TaxID=2650471 RepID=A0A5K7X6E4_9BACT|nr:diadenylate cyclase [Lacipirellula parvula]BBO32294.1 diadenylate cyclase spyDAC [Lacipirellula parvula]
MLGFALSIEKSIESFGAMDAVDIAIASVLVYAVLYLLWTTHNRTLLLAAAGLVGVYLAASAFELYLTELALRSAALGLLVLFGIAFQEDIRRAILLRWRWRGSGRAENWLTSGPIDELIDFIAKSAEQRVGVLVVIQGRDALDSVLKGGINLSAPVNVMLLQSIFDPRTPGHDGAVIVQDGRIVRMSAHLPLSNNLRELRSRGTRHSAGLGLSEIADALVVIVSEERGAICVAYGGALHPVTTPIELKQRIDAFLKEKYPAPNRPRFAGPLVGRLGLKVAAVAIAAIAWALYASHADTIERSFAVPLEFRNVPTNLVVNDDAPDSVRVMHTGSEPAFALLTPKTLEVRVNLQGFEAGTSNIALTSKNCIYPSDLKVIHVDPSEFQVQLSSSERAMTRD